MRKFLNTRFSRIKNNLAVVATAKKTSLVKNSYDIEDTDEGRIINQYNIYRNYILKVRKRVIAGQY